MVKIYILFIFKYLMLVSGPQNTQYLLDYKTRTCYRIVNTINLAWSNAKKKYLK